MEDEDDEDEGIKNEIEANNPARQLNHLLVNTVDGQRPSYECESKKSA